MDAQKTGGLIAQARREKGLTQRELAQALHVSAQAVSKWERGLNFPDLALLEPLGDCLGLTVSELLSGTRGEEPKEELLRDSLRILPAQLGGKVAPVAEGGPGLPGGAAGAGPGRRGLVCEKPHRAAAPARDGDLPHRAYRAAASWPPGRRAFPTSTSMT